MSSQGKDTGDNKVTNGLLTCGIVISPLFFAVVFSQAFTRAGFDLRRVPLSLLSLGDLGWIQIANFIITGLLALACAIGVRRALAGSKGGTWGPVLVATYGLGHILSGIFHPDPAMGFPPGIGAPAGASATMSSGATIHAIGFLIVVISLTAACFVFFRRFRSLGQNGWGFYSVTTGVAAPLFVVVGIATSNFLFVTGMAFITYSWLSLTAAHLRAELRDVS